MKWSLSLSKISGINIYIHWTFLILMIWILIMHIDQGHDLGESLMGVLFILILFTFVLFHELGHALVGKKYGITTKNIVILPIGGVANMEKMPEKPIQELWVALAGPAVNLAVAAVLYLIIQQRGGIPNLLEMEAHMSSSNFLVNLFLFNILLAVFNLIPAFPMDGGRVLRALLAMKLDRSKATAIAAQVGQFLAMGFVFIGLFYNVWLVFIGLFIFLGASAESNFEATRSILSKYKVENVLMKQFSQLSPHDPIEKAVDQLLNSQEKEFLISENNQVIGYISQEEIIKGLHEKGKEGSLADITRTDFLKLNPDMALDRVYELMSKKKISFSPVFQNEALIGVLDTENITELLMIDKATK